MLGPVPFSVVGGMRGSGECETPEEFVGSLFVFGIIGR